MAIEVFEDKLRLSTANKAQLATIASIIDEYTNEGYRLTLRQLYYQLVSRDIIPNQQKEYAKLSNLLVKGRMAGIIDWDSIEDRIRIPYIPYYAENISDALSDLIRQYRLDRQQGQNRYIELWVEKDALSGVLKPLTSHYHIRLVVNRGYSSCTAMHDAYTRIVDACEDSDRIATIFYLGDHDPSGLDMVRDIQDRLSEFGLLNMVDVNVGDRDYSEHIPKFEVIHIGLTDEQVKKYSPPPNPAKFSDPRAKWYVQKYGKTSWEVDALNPKVLNKLIKKHVEDLIDMKLFNDQLQKEEHDKKALEEYKAQKEIEK